LNKSGRGVIEERGKKRKIKKREEKREKEKIEMIKKRRK
jgi:hypothetical protein